MILDFYTTGFDVTKNGVYEELDAYLSVCGLEYETEYKYIEPALNVTIKLPIDSHVFTKKWDYCVAYDKDSGNVYYYYIMNCKWKGKETLELSLGLDTLNTFWVDISKGLTNETHITRRFKDRYKIVDTVAYSIVDPVEEDFSSVPMVRKSMTSINPIAGPLKWNLVYMTQYDGSDADVARNPITCYAIPSSAVTINTHQEGTVTWNSSTFSTDIAFAASASENIGFEMQVNDVTLQLVDLEAGSIWILWSKEYNKYYVKHIYRDYSTGTEYCKTYSSEAITFTQCGTLYEQDWDYVDSLNATTGAKYLPMEGRMDLSAPYEVNAGVTYQKLLSYTDWYETNKTDSRLIKIRELPYAPFKETYSGTTLIIPTGWVVEGQKLKFTGTTFGDYQIYYQHDTILPQLLKSDIKRQKVADIKYETKMYNSTYYINKYVYDTNAWVQQLELNTIWDEGAEDMGILYKVSDGMDNGMLFKFESAQQATTDFNEYLVVDKNTDKPYFTNEYLNYIRYGKYYDEKAANWNLTSSIVSSGGSMLSSAASGAFAASAIAGGATAGAVGGALGAAIGATVGLISAAISIGKTANTYRDSINSKIDQYQSQASSVSGTSDVSLFNYYSGNKLLRIQYEPRTDIKVMIYNYFRLYGYACDEYSVPNFNSRLYVDYIKCEPVFNGTLIWNQFLDDIKQRMNLGFRVFHLQDVEYYDLNLEYENFESALVEWAQA